jgi:hypothetical protein
MSDLRLTIATLADAALLGPMAIDFKVDDPEPRSERELVALRALLVDPTPGVVFRIDDEVRTIGYAILCWGYSVEFAGRDAILDELYIPCRTNAAAASASACSACSSTRPASAASSPSTSRSSPTRPATPTSTPAPVTPTAAAA